MFKIIKTYVEKSQAEGSLLQVYENPIRNPDLEMLEGIESW